MGQSKSIIIRKVQVPRSPTHKSCSRNPARIEDWNPFRYYSFGMLMPERNYNANSYRFGYNTQEKTDEISGSGNHSTAMFWEYDTRLGRRWNQDPKPNPSVSNYATFLNNPILLTDIFGDSSVFDRKGNKIYYDPKDKDLRVFVKEL